MKTQLRIQPNSLLPDENVIELWYGGNLIGTVVGFDGPGVRVLSKHPMRAGDDNVGAVNVFTVQIFPS